MKDKEKQIEKMAKEICKVCKSLESACFFTKQPCSLIKDVAKTLYEQGYRKLPENSVVLSQEEYNLLRVMADSIEYGNEKVKNALKHSYEKARKETAEKFVNDLPKNIEKYLKENLKENDDIKGKQDLIDFATIVAKRLAKETAKQFGVEIKE